MRNNQHHLLPYIRPIFYSIKMHPEFSKFTFSGEVSITFELRKKSKRITLHAVDLTISSCHLSQEGKKYTPTCTTFQKKDETVTFYFAKSLSPKKALIEIKFQGHLSQGLKGFYKSSYLYYGKKRYIAATQFEPTDARKAFPCIDEPSAKAIFEIYLTVPKHYTAISNTLPLSIRKTNEKEKIVHFSPTPKMSTYVLTFIAGEFESIQKRTKDRLLVRVFTPFGKVENAKFSLNFACKVVSFFNAYLRIPYPLPVLDLIALPDFEAGAMENWGAITFRESTLLMDPDHSPLSTKQRIAVVIAHEIAHMWFGNLVTMKWWDDLWLNEGFASYLEYTACDHIYPSWDMKKQFANDIIFRAKRLDALKTSHPIESRVSHPSDISQIFDEVSYCKGAAIVRMLVHYLGEKKFQQGLHRYLKKFQYKNAQTQDLWKMFENTSKKPVAFMMNKWTKNAGFPLILIKPTKQKDTFIISQKRFFSNGFEMEKKREKTAWMVPVSYKISYQEKSSTFNCRKYRNIHKIQLKPTDWIKCNYQEIDFCHVQYSEDLFLRLIKPISAKKLPAVDRLGILSDSFSLSRIAQLSSKNLFKLIESYRNEDDYTVLYELCLRIDELDTLLFHNQYYSIFQEWIRTIFQKQADTLGWNKKRNESDLDTMKRTVVLSQMIKFGDKKSISRAKKLFAYYIQRKKSIDPNMKPIIFSAAARYGDTFEYNAMKKLFHRTENHEEKNRLLQSMSLFTDKNLTKKTLSFSLSSHVRPQDAIYAFAAASDSQSSRETCWNFFKDYFADISNTYRDARIILSRLISYTTRQFTSEVLEKDIKHFFQDHPIPGTNLAIEQSLEQIRSNIYWKNHALSDIEKCLCIWKKNRVSS